MADEHSDAPGDEALQHELNEARAAIERLEHEAAVASAAAQQSALDADALREALQRAQDESASEAAALRTQVDDAAARARNAASRYRDLMLRLEPGLPAELVGGETVDEIDASITAARSIAASVRARIAEQSETARVPAGAPSRGVTDLSALTPAQKIAWGLAHRD